MVSETPYLYLFGWIGESGEARAGSRCLRLFDICVVL